MKERVWRAGALALVLAYCLAVGLLIAFLWNDVGI